MSKPTVWIDLRRLIGDVENHPRLGNEPHVTTSEVVKVTGLCIVETRNTIYLLRKEYKDE